jgi:hypothetical protein
MTIKIRAVREPDCLAIVNRVMKEEERQAENHLERGTPDWLRRAKIVLWLTTGLVSAARVASTFQAQRMWRV